MRNVITMLLLVFTTIAMADSLTIFQDMNGNFLGTAMTMTSGPVTIYNPTMER